MGSACTTPEIAEQNTQNRKIEKMIKKDQNDELGNQKLLLLGTGECGKSTILKQMQILHKNGFTPQEMDTMKQVVYSNIILGMEKILKSLDSLMLHLSSEKREIEASMIIKLKENRMDMIPFTPDCYQALKHLWADPIIQQAYARRSEFQLGEAMDYFMNQLDRIADPSYRPSYEDVLHVRVPTTGVVQIQFPIKGCIFKVFDVGGQRSERRKWIHLFDDVNAIIFISAISEYDQVLIEDNKSNRLSESMDLFSQICNSKWFVKSSMILFLNKIDLFEEKLKYVSISVLFQSYTGGNSYSESIAYLRTRFEKYNENKKSRKLYMHETCATNTNQVELVIDSVVDTVIGKNLRGTGME